MPSYAVTTTSYGSGNLKWLRTSKGLKTAKTVTLDVSTFTSGTHYPNGYIPAGIALGKITASGEYGPYSDAAVDGRTVMSGILIHNEPVTVNGISATKIVTAMITEGDVIEAKLPTNHGVDANGKADVGVRFDWT